jgi:hypothetical protein
MQKEIRYNSEIIFVFVTMFHFACYGLDSLATYLEWPNYYGLNFELFQNIVDLSFLLLIWGFAKDWGFLGKRCLVTMIMLSFLNIFDSVFFLTSYYAIFFLILILNFTYALMYQWKK